MIIGHSCIINVIRNFKWKIESHKTNFEFRTSKMYKQKNPYQLNDKDFIKKTGGDLLSRFRSTIGAGRLNFSVRNGKRWALPL